MATTRPAMRYRINSMRRMDNTGRHTILRRVRHIRYRHLDVTDVIGQAFAVDGLPDWLIQ
jgi:hypothetical protein